jgi:cysteine-rich repeat protein
MAPRSYLLLWCAVGALGCDVFDEKLEQRLEPSTGNDAGSDEDAGSGLFMLSSQCEGQGGPPEVEGSADMITVSIEGLSSNVSETGCNLPNSVLAGADGFFKIDANAGDRWHFHLNAAPGQDVAVMAVKGCDLRSCEASANVCGVGESEHFTFVPDTAGTYVVVVEGIDPSIAAPLKMVAIQPTCGNNSKEHGEVCDFGDRTPGDGCDAHCRVELRANRAAEVEPNDDSYLANVLLPGNDNPMQILGEIAGSQCQPDHYLVRTSKEQELTLSLLGANGKACAGAPPMELAIFEADGQELKMMAPVASAKNDAGDTCPALAPETLPEGAYFVRVRHLKPATEAFPYRLDLTWSEPKADPVDP